MMSEPQQPLGFQGKELRSPPNCRTRSWEGRLPGHPLVVTPLRRYALTLRIRCREETRMDRG